MGCTFSASKVFSLGIGFGCSLSANSSLGRGLGFSRSPRKGISLGMGTGVLTFLFSLLGLGVYFVLKKVFFVDMGSGLFPFFWK